MMRFFFAFLLTPLVASAASAQVIYALNPAGSGEIEDVLGGNAALKASNFYDFMVKEWEVPTVEPVYNDKVINNVVDLIPYEVVVVPELVTVHTSQVRGSGDDFKRQKTSAVNPLPVTVNPAEDSVFIYAFNKDGKLIYPFASIPTGNAKDYTSIYRIQAFQEHSNFTSFFQPIVTNIDIDITGTYTKDRPNMNPPNALMFRGRTVGQYSLTLAVQFNELFLSDSTPQKVKELASKIVTKTVEVNVVDGPETIDQLLFNASRTLGMQDPLKDLGFAIKEGESLEVSLSGRKFRKKWDKSSQQYQDDGSVNVMLKQANWNYSNLNQKVGAPYDVDLIFIRKLTADGTSAHILANKLPSTATEGTGTITIDAHGRRFNINVRVVK